MLFRLNPGFRFGRQQRSNLRGREEVTSHQRQFFRDCDQFDGKGPQIWFFDDHSSASFKDAVKFADSLSLMNNVVQRVHHQDAVERAVREGQTLGFGGGRREFLLTRLRQHPARSVRDDKRANVRTKRLGHASRPAARVEQSPRVGQIQNFESLLQPRKRNDAVIEWREKVEVGVH